MRVIKFRAWHEENKAMVCFDNSKLVSDTYQMQHLAMLVNGQYGDVLMQFTGLQDVNGVDIYEGDIVSSDYYAPDIKEIAIVIFQKKDNFCRFGFDSPEQDAFEYGNLEVIGNIHENPELLIGDL